MKKYLITGITGFAGAHMVNRIHHEDSTSEIYGLVRGSNGMETDILDVVPLETFQKIKFIYGNIEDRQAMMDVFKNNKFDGVFHLAAQSHPPTSLLFPIDTFKTNIMGTANIIDAIEKNNPDCKLLFCSTSEVYGNTGSDGRIIKETDTILPSNPYACSKASSDLYMQERMSNGRIRGCITRAFSHTGPRRGKNFSISADAFQIAKIMRSQQASVLKVGNLETTRVVLDVRCVVRAYYRLMVNEGSNGNVYNVCGDTPHKMGYFTDMLISMSGREIEKRISEEYYRKVDIHYQHGNTEKLTELTGWGPEIPINKTMHDLLAYWLKKIS